MHWGWIVTFASDRAFEYLFNLKNEQIKVYIEVLVVSHLHIYSFNIFLFLPSCSKKRYQEGYLP